MYGDAETAEKCFAENVQLFTDATTTPEKFNLYTGLTCLARALGDFDSRLGRIEDEVHKIKNSVHVLR